MNPNWRKSYIRYRALLLDVVNSYKKREDVRVYLEIFLSLATISLFSIFALRPTLLTIAELIKEIETKKETVAVMESKIQSLSKAQILYDRERANIQLLEEAIPSSPSPDGLARQIEGLSLKNQAALSGLSIGNATIVGNEKVAPVTGEDVEVLPEGAGLLSYSLSFTTTIDNYPILINFLKDLENLRRQPNVAGINFVHTTNSELENGLTLTLSGAAPYLNKTSRITINP